jgi:hypothetical protein
VVLVVSNLLADRLDFRKAAPDVADEIPDIFPAFLLNLSNYHLKGRSIAP